jgi:hypothetical protein
LQTQLGTRLLERTKISWTYFPVFSVSPHFETKARKLSSIGEEPAANNKPDNQSKIYCNDCVVGDKSLTAAYYAELIRAILMREVTTKMPECERKAWILRQNDALAHGA